MAETRVTAAAARPAVKTGSPDASVGKEDGAFEDTTFQLASDIAAIDNAGAWRLNGANPGAVVRIGPSTPYSKTGRLKSPRERTLENLTVTQPARTATWQSALRAHPRLTLGARLHALACTSALWLSSCALAGLAGCAAMPYSAPQADATPTAKALKQLPRRGERAAVAVYEVRSSVGAVDARAATDMFTSALVQSGRFRVVERGRLNEGAMREKQINVQGMSTGISAQRRLTGAEYVFEVVLSEANVTESQRSVGMTLAGMQIGAGSNRDSIALDVRIVQVGNGEIVDAVRVLKLLKSDQVSVSGIGNLLATAMGRKGRDPTYAPDFNFQQQRREGADAALRAAIDEAVVQLARRFDH